ncbi:MAG: YqaJ viral recombinase family protein [Lutibacter sp.]
MKIDFCLQQSPEWWMLKKGKISGTRFGMAISGVKNRLIFDLISETISEYLFPDDYVNDDMQFGLDNEQAALEEYKISTGIDFIQVGAIISDASAIHMASPDAMSVDLTIVQEVKCTQDGGIHVQRFFDGPDKKYLGQIINYFAVDDSIEEVHWISYCPSLQARPLIIKKLLRSDFTTEINKGRIAIKKIEAELPALIESFIF